jgi:hypothetical protein
MTYYEVLEIDSRATTEEIERAYRRLARKVHPDLNAGGDAAKAEARMKLLNEIRDTLTDPLLRAGYDERLRLESLQRTATPRPPPSAADDVPAPPVIVHDPADSTGQRRARSRGLFVTLFLLALGGGVVGVAALSTRRFDTSPAAPIERPLVADASAATAPLLTTPVTGASPRVVPAADLHATPDPAPEPPPARVHPRRRGVVRIGSTAEDVLRILGPPTGYERGSVPGESVLHYGTLRLEIKNGRVTGGDAAAR